MHDIARTANLLGAATLTLGDLLTATVSSAAGASTSGSAALTTLANEAGLGVTELGERIGLSQPAAARMVDNLAARGLVERRQGGSGRSVAVHLTESGRAAAQRVLMARAEELSGFVEALEPAERASLARSLEKLLDRLYDEVGSKHVLCRLCDRGACTADRSTCPVGRAAQERGGG